MKNLLSKHKILFVLFLLISTASFFRIYNLNWGAPFYFHPDERNIASSVSQLRFPENMNPHFFAYGSLPIYTIYTVGMLFQMLHQIQAEPGQVHFETAIVVARSFSAMFGILLLPLLYLVGKQLKDKRSGMIALLLGITSTGLIQFAHFGTFEMWLTFFSLLLFYLCLLAYRHLSILMIALLAIVAGALVAVKVSSLVLFPIPLFTLFLAARHRFSHHKRIIRWAKRSLVSFSVTVFFLTVTAAFYIGTNPYVLLDTKSFLGSIRYESGVALGTILVFYTGEFFNTIPGFYHMLHVYPFLLNPLLAALILPATLFLSYLAIRKRHIPYVLLLLFFFSLFLSQIFLFVKWVRYFVPTLPFLYLLFALSFSELSHVLQKANDLLSLRLVRSVLFVLITISTLFAFSYFMTAFIEKDTRVAASEWAEKSIGNDAPILSEVYDLGITPFNPHFSNIDLFHFYDLDNNSLESSLTTLADAVKTHQVIVLPSQRILKARLTDPDRFPNGHVFYTQLFQNKSLYEKLYETPCSVFCKIVYLGNPVFAFEGTANLFDRPTVYIFKIR